MCDSSALGTGSLGGFGLASFAASSGSQQSSVDLEVKSVMTNAASAIGDAGLSESPCPNIVRYIVHISYLIPGSWISYDTRLCTPTRKTQENRFKKLKCTAGFGNQQSAQKRRAQ